VTVEWGLIVRSGHWNRKPVTQTGSKALARISAGKRSTLAGSRDLLVRIWQKWLIMKERPDTKKYQQLQQELQAKDG